MNMKRLLAAAMALAVLLAGMALAESDNHTQIVNLKTMGRENPVGIDAQQPEFSWQMISDAVGAGQTAYQITLWDEDDSVVWDSGRVESAESHGIAYEGPALTPSTAYTWQVAVTDNAGATVESGRASFVTALMSDSFDAWDGAQWIGSPTLPLDAASKSVFHITAAVTLAEFRRRNTPAP